jgi:hypothetical protein
MASARRLILAILALGLLSAPAAQADWVLYLSGDLGTSSGTTSVDGFIDVAGIKPFSGQYTDSSPLISGALGISLPIDEITPWELPYDLRLPSWPLRFEVEATGLRSFEGLSDGPVSDVIFGSTSSWSLMFDLWLDIPLGSLNRPLASLVGRTPHWIKSGLDHTIFFAGGGVGVAGMEFFMTDNEQFTSDDTQNFAWQVGAGFGYLLSEAVTLNLGYRYFDYGSANGRLINRATTDVGPLSVSQVSHEFRGGIRINIWGFRGPWR